MLFAKIVQPTITAPASLEENLFFRGQNLVNVKLLMSGKTTGCFFDCSQREDHISPIVKPPDRWLKIVA
ncbi:G2/M phase-specific E3 ubiquitin-protein ligase [Trichinella spiralis]|uniref:G2/M phase-specific E3 ubiquitin-protein ligase n=1 Tax=Trichinella spiralis TaxID=6334 RepID=A0ABR3KJB0_TRISP